MHEISQGCAFWGFRQKWSPQPPLAPNSENFALQKSFFCSKRVNLGVSATKIGISPWVFKFGVKNLAGNGILAISVQAQQKIG